MTGGQGSLHFTEAPLELMIGQVIGLVWMIAFSQKKTKQNSNYCKLWCIDESLDLIGGGGVFVCCWMSFVILEYGEILVWTQVWTGVNLTDLNLNGG